MDLFCVFCHAMCTALGVYAGLALAMLISLAVWGVWRMVTGAAPRRRRSNGAHRPHVWFES